MNVRLAEHQAHLQGVPHSWAQDEGSIANPPPPAHGPGSVAAYPRARRELPEFPGVNPPAHPSTGERLPRPALMQAACGSHNLASQSGDRATEADPPKPERRVEVPGAATVPGARDERKKQEHLEQGERLLAHHEGLPSRATTNRPQSNRQLGLLPGDTPIPFPPCASSASVQSRWAPGNEACVLLWLQPGKARAAGCARVLERNHGTPPGLRASGLAPDSEGHLTGLGSTGNRIPFRSECRLGLQP